MLHAYVSACAYAYACACALVKTSLYGLYEVQLEAWRHKMFHIFHFFQSG